MRIRWILRTFYEHGAPESILYDAKPHIGTDILINVVQSIRKAVIAHGGEVRFNSKLTGLVTENNTLRAVRVTDETGEYELPCERLILAVGHSARDTFEMLEKTGVPMEAKPFSMGARIEHKQKMINISQYGEDNESCRQPTIRSMFICRTEQVRIPSACAPAARSLPRHLNPAACVQTA